jgi:hypothetical protein
MPKARLARNVLDPRVVVEETIEILKTMTMRLELVLPLLGVRLHPIHYHGSKEHSVPSSDCVEVEVVEESPVAMTISSSSGDGGPKYQSGSDSSSLSSSLSSSPERSVVEDENTGGGDTEDENTGGGDTGLKEGQDVGSSSFSSDDDEEK